MRTILAAGALAIGATAGYLTCHRTLSARLRAADRAATHDPLTGTLNRAGLHHTAPRCLAAGSGVVVALVDLVGFKRVNDTCGHDAGDAILTAVAERLADIAGPHGCAARLGGDEFAVITTTRDIRRWLATTHARITVPVDRDGARLAVGATIGATPADPGMPLAALLKAADHAMYEARKRHTTSAIASIQPGQSDPVRDAVRERDQCRPTRRLATVAAAA